MQSGLHILGVIPARLHSTRLPRKVLRTICGKPMIQHVFERARGCTRLDELVVATDSDEVRQLCDSLGIPAVITSPTHPSGTDRVYEVLSSSRAEIAVNIQGDEPMLHAGHIDALLRPFDQDTGVQVTTLYVPIDAQEAASPDNVKVVCNSAGDALYFSRSPVPYLRNRNARVVHYLHLGLYAYRRSALELFCRLAPSELEVTEGLEQLRFLEHGVSLRVVRAPFATVGVDTEEDLRRVEQMMMQSEAA